MSNYQPWRDAELNIVIRRETESDIGMIAEITKRAFATLAISNHTEQFIIDALRKADALTLSLVAQMATAVVGHVAFSPVVISDDSRNWYGLGPVSVLPEFQKQGIGRSLIREGLDQLRASGGQGCILVGDPGYYTRLGFMNLPDLAIDGVPPENILSLPFYKDAPRGSVMFHQAFAATS